MVTSRLARSWFDSDIGGFTWNDMMEDITQVIGDMHRTHNYLLPFLEDAERTEFTRILNKDPTLPGLKYSLMRLSSYLTRFHGNKCIVLIDEYDAPLDKAYNKGYYHTAMEFFRSLFSSLLKENEDVHKVFLAGVLRVGNSGVLSGLNNLCVYSMTSSRFADKFGFTEDEVALLCAQHKIDIPINDVEAWYGGYQSSSSFRQYKMYNPWSIARLCSGNELQMYWNVKYFLCGKP
ncbi:hypothetical protein BC938DRAFT_483122 [Jimgerdemannia flammicorona]|uniref:AAA-ATPase-like domain-containing protein n=1 Tax=Jimgerdemannia flammicorona TaxID=994334 RepID=A0A433QCN5_9FUNG|nr:hypothetical protein BC938DRAFT_483122 [Jimgerdemannia flammicorona]